MRDLACTLGPVGTPDSQDLDDQARVIELRSTLYRLSCDDQQAGAVRVAAARLYLESLGAAGSGRVRKALDSAETGRDLSALSRADLLALAAQIQAAADAGAAPSAADGEDPFS